MITSSYPRYTGDGAGSFVASLARALAGLGHDIHVIAPYDPQVADMDQAGVQVHRFRYAPLSDWHIAGHGHALEADRSMKGAVPLLMPGYLAAGWGAGMRLCRREPFDLIHGHWAVPGGLLAGWLARSTRLPFVISMHGSDVYVLERNRLYAALARGTLRRAQTMLACSQDLRRRSMALGVPADKCLVVPYGADSDRYRTGDGARLRTTLGIPPEAPVVGALGRLVHKKGFEHLITAMPRVIAAMPGAYGVIGGAGDLLDALRRQAGECGVAHRVLLPGAIDWQQTPDFYAMCDVVAVPSVVDARGNVDGLPNVLLEAMASGRAIVASRVGGLPDVLQHEKTGLLVPPGSAESLADAVIRLLGDATVRDRLGDAARHWIATAQSWEQIARQHEAVYQRAISAIRP
jgi:glycosyltransferase involved in cell wall biosynthesis